MTRPVPRADVAALLAHCTTRDLAEFASRGSLPARMGLGLIADGKVLGLPFTDRIFAVTPRGLAKWVSALGQAATHAGGMCLLVDDVDVTAETSWKAAFVAALRFTFQSASGITPIYAAWKLFLDESLPGSNYFRNVTRPVFLEPFARGGEPFLGAYAYLDVAPKGWNETINGNLTDRVRHHDAYDAVRQLTGVRQ